MLPEPLSLRALIGSTTLHLGLAALLLFGAEFRPRDVAAPQPVREIVNATTIDRRAVEAEIERLKKADAAAKRAEDERLKKAQSQAEELARQRKAEEQKLQELKAEQERLTAAKDKAAKQKVEAEKRAAEARKKAADEEAKREAAKKKAEEEARKKRAAEQKAAEAKKQAAEAEKKKREAARKAEERERMEKALREELAAEEAAARAAADSAEINRFVAAIAARVRQSFTILPGFDGLSCTLRITLVPGGEVAGVQIVRSSGNASFDRQAENAVRKAAPLPVPTEPRLFEQVRSISFVFDPQI